MQYNKIVSLAALFAVTTATAAQAATATSSLQADLPVQSACAITATTNFNFAAISAGPLTSTEAATGSVAYACSAVPNTLTLNDTLGAFALTGPTGSTPVAFTITGVNTQAGTLGTFADNIPTLNVGAGALATDTITLTATLAPTAGQTTVTGTYTDVITATLNFT